MSHGFIFFITLQKQNFLRSKMYEGLLAKSATQYGCSPIYFFRKIRKFYFCNQIKRCLTHRKHLFVIFHFEN